MSIYAKAAQSLFGRARTSPALPKSGVEHDAIDDYVLQDMRRDSTRFSALMDEPFDVPTDDGGQRPFELSGDLNDDIFRAYHTTAQDVQARKKGEVRESHELIRQIDEAFVRSDDFLRTQPYTRGDRISAGLSAAAARDELAKALGEDMREHMERAEEMSEQEQALGGLEQLLDEYRQQAREAKDAGQPIPQDLVDDIKQATRERNATRGNLAELIRQQDAVAPSMRAAVVEAVERASEAGKDISEVWASLPGNEPGSGSRISPDEALALAAKWKDNPAMKDLARLVGRMKRDFKAKAARKVIGGSEEVVGAELGSDLARIYPAELMQLKHPAMRLNFVKNWAAGSLVQRRLQGYAHAGLGPFLLALDKSESMSWALGTFPPGAKDRFATAAAIAAIANANRTRRDVGVVQFNAGLIGEHYFPAKQIPDLHAITDIATRAPSGGTTTTLAVRWCRDRIVEAPEFKRADVVLVTDGADTWSEEAERLRDELRAMGVRIFAICVGLAPTAYATNLADEVFSVFDLADSSATDPIALAIT